MADVKLSNVVLAVLLFVVPVASGGSTPTGPDDENWANSPEAYFLTAAERKEWDGLRSRENRVDFIERYWLKRDPTPGTTTNEFRDLVLARIRTADKRYRIEKIPDVVFDVRLLDVFPPEISRIDDFHQIIKYLDHRRPVRKRCLREMFEFRLERSERLH